MIYVHIAVQQMNKHVLELSRLLMYSGVEVNISDEREQFQGAIWVLSRAVCKFFPEIDRWCKVFAIQLQSLGDYEKVSQLLLLARRLDSYCNGTLLVKLSYVRVWWR